MGDRRVRVDGWPPRDRGGSIEPHKINMITLFRRIPSAVKLFDAVVPVSHWSTVSDDQTDELIAIIDCTCGETVSVSGARCVECACERFFVFLITEVRCYRPEAEEAAGS